jgi:hypothetical protein
LSDVKRGSRRVPLIPIVVAVLCVIVAVGAGLEGRFVFGGPIWTPGQPPAPAVSYTPQPQNTIGSTSAPKIGPIGNGITISWLPILIIFGCLVIAVIALLVLYWVRYLRRRAGRFGGVDNVLEDESEILEVEDAADLPVLHRGLVRASDVLETERSPRDAIIRAWLGLQEAAEDSGLTRRPSETPTEFTARVFASVDADRAAAAALLQVYLRVRFRARPATAADVVVAREAIDRLRETWPARAEQ